MKIPLYLANILDTCMFDPLIKLFMRNPSQKDPGHREPVLKYSDKKSRIRQHRTFSPLAKI